MASKWEIAEVNQTKPVIGVLTVTLHLPESGSLKSKRQVVSSLVRRLRDRFEVSAAEVGERNLWQTAHLAVACVSADSTHADQVLASALRFLERESAGDAVLTEVRTELIRL